MYLLLKFQDNDFSFPMRDALEGFWQYIKDNNEIYFSNKNDKYPRQVFERLHNAGQLIPLLCRTWVLHTLLREVETATRHINEDGISKYSKEDWMSNNTPVEDTYTKYLGTFSIEFHKNKDDEYQNGEYGWLDLYSGEATVT